MWALYDGIIVVSALRVASVYPDTANCFQDLHMHYSTIAPI